MVSETELVEVVKKTETFHRPFRASEGICSVLYQQGGVSYFGLVISVNTKD